ncbi:MAG: DUF1028 domain-containing protein [Bacteroidetes bacterium]|nr:DUF1028 domain-containing protein [Bacteroidota bacterium]
MKTSYLKILVIHSAILLPHLGVAQNVYKEKFAHTFSIVARDKTTGEMAVGVQSHWFSVGTLVSWGKSGVGVVATQSFVNPAFGPEGLKLMEEGKNAKDALVTLIAGDVGREFRQVALLDAKGVVNAFTGKKCVESAHHIVGTNFSVQANMMLNDKIVPAMAKAFEKNNDLPLAERVLKVLQAAQDAGGDIRGKQSAVILVVNGEKTDKPWLDKKIDLRVDDHETPLIELERLLRVHRAYEHMNRGDLAIELNDMKTALTEYEAAEKMFPENLEMKYWKAIAMANNNQLDKALPIFKEIFAKDKNWREMTKRLPKAGLLNLSESDLKKIIDL